MASCERWTVNDAPPYSDNSNGQKLNELTSYWSANLASVPRALTLMLSGRGGGGAAGVAWVDGLCSKAYGYAFGTVLVHNQSNGTVHVVIDVTGYFR